LATKPIIKGEIGTPSVTIKVQTPIYRALSFLKNVSVTTPLPTDAGGQRKNITIALHSAIVA
jgi:hypothetical protein